jgi:hypothetical protein
METVTPFIDQAMDVLRDGFANINNPKGLLIALAATVFMQSWRQWLPFALLATVVHIGIEVLTPVLQGGGPFRLPPLMEAPFWTQTGVLFVGYLIVIAVFFFAKRLLFRGGGAAAKAH